MDSYKEEVSSSEGLKKISKSKKPLKFSGKIQRRTNT